MSAITWAQTRGGTDLERGYGDVRPWRPPFHASPAARKGPISSKRVSSQDPLLRKFWNFSLNSLNFHPNFSSQAPKFGNFPLTSPPFQRQMSVRKPHTSEIRAAHPYLKKVECPPPPCSNNRVVPPFHFSFMILAIIMSIPLTFPVFMSLPNYYKRFSIEGKTDLSEGRVPPKKLIEIMQFSNSVCTGTRRYSDTP